MSYLDLPRECTNYITLYDHISGQGLFLIKLCTDLFISPREHMLWVLIRSASEIRKILCDYPSCLRPFLDLTYLDNSAYNYAHGFP